MQPMSKVAQRVRHQFDDRNLAVNNAIQIADTLGRPMDVYSGPEGWWVMGADMAQEARKMGLKFLSRFQPHGQSARR